MPFKFNSFRYTKGWAPSRYQGADVAVHHFKWHEGVLASVKDRLEYYRGDDPKNPRYAWYTDSEKLMASIGETGKVDVKKSQCKKSQPGAMVRGRNAMRRRRRRRSRALLSEEEGVDSAEGSEGSRGEAREEEIEQMEAKVDVAEATLEVLEEREVLEAGVAAEAAAEAGAAAGAAEE